MESVSSTEGFDISQFDHFGQEFAQHPEALWAAMRDLDGLGRSEKYDGFTIIARYDDICEAARNAEVFSSAVGGVAIPPQPMPNLIPVETDAPLHAQYRRILAAALGPTAIARREPEYRQLADQLLAAVADRDEFDFFEAFSSQFPQLVSLRTIGFDAEDRASLGKWFHDVTHLRGIDEEAVAAGVTNMFRRIKEVAGERREVPRRDDLLSLLLDGEIDDRRLTDDEILMYVTLLLFGGLGTTASAITGAFHYLAQHPEDRQRLLDDEVALDKAVEEIVRWTSPVQALARTATADTTIGGCPVARGEQVLLLWGAGNRDETEFDAPDEIQLDRTPNRHLGFGMGPHRCIGSHLAKTMVKIAVQRGLPALGEFEVADESEVRWATGEARGIVHLPLRRKR